MNIGELSDAEKVNLDESDMSMCNVEQRAKDDNYPSEEIKIEECSQIDQTERDVHKCQLLDVSELCLDHRSNAYITDNPAEKNIIPSVNEEANNICEEDVSDTENERTSISISKSSEQNDSREGNELSKNFYNIEVEIARIVGEEVNQDNKNWTDVNNGANLHKRSDQQPDDPIEIEIPGGEKNVDDKYVEALDEKASIDFLTDALEDKESKENTVLKTEINSNDEEHENSIDEEEIEDYEMFLLNSSIESDAQEQTEPNEPYQTEIYLSDPEDTHDAELGKKPRVGGSDDESDARYDIMQLAEVKEVETLHRCSICQYITPHLASLRRHISITHSKNPWTCKYCRKKFTSRFFGEKHIQAEHSRKNRKCPYCSFLTLCSATVMQKHITFAHGFKAMSENDIPKGLKRNSLREVMKCEHCAFSDKSREVMQSHLRMHSLKYVLRCIHCYYMINNRKMYDEHVKSAHKLAKKIFICTKCFFQSEEWEEYYCHINTPHNFHSCSKCEFKSPYIEIFYNHINSHENDASEVDDNENLICGKCGYKACSNDNLICHLQAQHSENSRNEETEHMDDGESFSKTRCKTPVRNMQNQENLIEFEEVDGTEQNGLGSNCTGEPSQHSELTKEHLMDSGQIDSEKSLETLKDNEKTDHIDNSEKSDYTDVEHHDLVGSSTAEENYAHESAQCFESDEFIDHLNQPCPKCPFWSKNPRAFEAHMISHNPESGTSSSEHEYEMSERSRCSLLPQKIPVVDHVKHIFTIDANRIEKTSYHIHEASGENEHNDNFYRHSVHSDMNAQEFDQTYNNVDETNINIISSNHTEQVSNHENNVEELYVSRHPHDKSVNKEYISLFPQKFKDNYSDEENLFEKITDKSMKIVKILKHQCFDCLMIYKTRYTLLDHRKKKHGLRKPHSCTYCMENFETYNCLKSHYYRVHRVSYHNSGAFFKCPICDFTSIRKKQIMNHVSRQHFKDHSHNIGFAL